MKQIAPIRTLTEQTYDALLEAICSGELAAGDRLNQDDIAARLRVSRQPVNSAITMLKANRFANDNGRRGVLVAPVDDVLLRSIFEYRQVIEPFAVRLAGRCLPDDARVQADAVLGRGLEAARGGCLGGLIHADAEFHEMVYRWSGNTVIQSSMALNWPHIRRSIGTMLREPGAALAMWDDHALIADALISGEADAAGQVMEAHIARAHRLTQPALNACETG